MALIKHRPRIKLLTVPQVMPGESFVVRVEIHARRPVPIEYIDVDLEGEERCTIGSGQYQTVRSRALCRARARVCDEDELPAGVSSFRARFSMPPTAPPTYNGNCARVSYLMHVRAAIPWWPDARASFEIHVSHRVVRHGGNPASGASANPIPKPLLFSSRPEGPNANEAHIEGSLSADVVVPGGLVSGAVALNNVAFTRYTGLRLALVGIEYVQLGGRSGRVEAHRYEVYLPVEKPTEGQRREYHMRLPHHVPASHRGPYWGLMWQLECKAEIRWGQDLVLRVPVEVIPLQHGERPRLERRAPPTVGSERVREVWRVVANAHALTFDGARITGAVGACELSVEREHRGRQGVYLRGQLRYPSLHLSIEIEPVRGSIFGSGGGVRFVGQRWDRNHRVHCRDDSQLQAIAMHLRGGLMPLARARMTDEAFSTEVRNAGVSRSRLNAFVGALVSMARAIEGARRDIPPPAAMVEGLASWTALATSMNGSLETARMAIAGVVAGVTTRVHTHWSATGQPVSTVVEMDAPMSIAEEHRGLFIGASDDEAMALEIDAHGSRARAQPGHGRGRIEDIDDTPGFSAIVEGAYRLSIDAEQVAITLPAPIVDALPLRERLQAMASWIRSLSGAAGPYR